MSSFEIPPILHVNKAYGDCIFCDRLGRTWVLLLKDKEATHSQESKSELVTGARRNLICLGHNESPSHVSVDRCDGLRQRIR